MEGTIISIQKEGDMNNLFSWKSLDIQEPEKIYYHKGLNKFFQVKEQRDDYFLIGGLCKYFSDAQTNIIRSRVSYEFMKDTELVKAVDKYAIHDGIGWTTNRDEEQ